LKKKRNRFFKKNSKKIISPFWFEKNEEKLKQKLLKNSNAISLDNGGNFGS